MIYSFYIELKFTSNQSTLVKKGYYWIFQLFTSGKADPLFFPAQALGNGRILRQSIPSNQQSFKKNP